MRNLHIAAAVVATLGAAAANAATPTLAACQGASQIYVAGSSAAQTAIVNALSDTLFSPLNYVVFVGSKPANNMITVCGTSVVTSGSLTSNTTYLVNYRFEGGSVVGVLPVATHKPIKFLDISLFTTTDAVLATTYTISGFGGGANNRKDDTFTATSPAKFQSHTVDIGISDVEPGLLVGANYPKFYSTTVFGSATASQMAGAGTARAAVFQQSFGIFVNTQIPGATYPLKLSKAMIGQILRGEVGDWNQVVDVTGTPVTTTSTAILVKNRETGSGSRAITDVYFNGTNCGGKAGSIADPTPASDFSSTGDALKSANSTIGALAYASLNNDQNTPFTSFDGNAPGASCAGQIGGQCSGTNNQLSVVWVDGVGTGTTPGTGFGVGGNANWSQLVAQQNYDFFAESYIINNGTDGSTLSTDFYNWVLPILSTTATAPHTAQINTIFSTVNTSAAFPALTSNPGTANRDTPIYVNQASRGGNSCSAPVGLNL